MIPESTFRQYIAAITGNAVRTLPDHRCAYNPWRCEPYDAPEYVPPAECERAQAKRRGAWWHVECDCGRCNWDDCSGFSVQARFRCQTTAFFWPYPGYPPTDRPPTILAMLYPTDRLDVFRGGLSVPLCPDGEGACSC